MKSPARQKGAALVVSLLMLAVLTILALTTVNTSSVDMKIAYNAQMQAEVEAAAQLQVESLLSNYRNFTTWDQNSPCATCTTWNPTTNPPSKSNPITINGQPYTVVFYRPICIGYADVGAGGDCSASSQGVVLSCNSAHWDVKVEVQDANTGAKTIFHQGVRMAINSSETGHYNGPVLDANLRNYCSG